MIVGRGPPWFPRSFPGGVPWGQARQRGSGFAQHILDHRAPVAIGEIGEGPTEIPARLRSRMGARFHGLTLGPGEQPVRRNQRPAFLSRLLRDDWSPLS